MDVVVPAGLENLNATGKDEAIEEMVLGLANAGYITSENVKAIKNSIIERERLGSTGIMNGVGVPHARHEKIGSRICAVGRSENGIPFDGCPTYVLFMILSPKDCMAEYLGLLMMVVMVAKDEDAIEAIRHAKDREEIRLILEKF